MLKEACLCGTFKENCLFMVDFVNNVRSFVNYAIFCELSIGCDLRSIVRNRTIA